MKRKPTLTEWADAWSRERVESGLYRSAALERARLLDFVRRAPFAHARLSKITPEDVRRYVIAETQREPRRGRSDGTSHPIAGARVSRRTVDMGLGVLRSCLRDAHEAGIIRRNPAARVRLHAEPRMDEPWTYLSLEEIALVTSPPVPLELRSLATIAICTGLRKGELWGLRWSDVTLGEHPYLTVRRSYDGPTKGGRPRTVPLLMPAMEALEVVRELTATRANPLGLVAPNRDGSMRSPYTITSWRRWCVRVGITRRVRWHDLRHTFASHLVMGSWGRAWRLEEIAAVLGHADLATTMRYAHLAPDRLFAAAAETTLFGGRHG